jgi:hypothetical protein
MGMFDSFIVEIEGREVELQTKRFDRFLQVCRLGSLMAGAPAGIRVYFDQLRIDDQGNRVYRDEAPGETYTVFVVLAYTVFVAYKAVKGALTDDVIEFQIAELQTTWSDSFHLIDFLIRTLAERQQQVAGLEHRVNRALRMIDGARKNQAGETISHFLIKDKGLERIEKGDEPLDVIQAALENDEPGWFEPDLDPSKKDRFEDHRL